MFFILGTGRCGSTSISEYLNRSPDCHCVHEHAPQLISEATLYAYGEYDHGRMVELLKNTRPTHVHGRQYGESHHKLSFVFPALHEAFPDARYVWLLRDGRDAVASMHARGWYTGSEQLHDWETWRVRGDRLGAFRPHRWRSLTPFEKCCWYWTHVNRMVQRSLDTVAERALRVRIEHIEDSAATMFGFLGLTVPVDNSPLPVSNAAWRQHEPVRHAEWTASQHDAFARLCGEAMDEWYPRWRASAPVTAPDRARTGLRAFLEGLTGMG